jgi:hypothetical protein
MKNAKELMLEYTASSVRDPRSGVVTKVETIHERKI